MQITSKYRPDNFAQLINQVHLIRSITNSIQTDKLPNALLLTGSHGIGKTSIARIIAKSINCLNKDNSTVEPCCKCNNCILIKKSQNPDVMELDAASHTSVNEIRVIIDNCKYLPIQSKFKVFIIDEVHMLSNSAFNALLKILEEPPLHVKFILATTEVNKIPLTVISRCQHFNLHRISSDLIADHLRNIATKEDVNFEQKALLIIASIANGSIRDALLILNNAISYAQSTCITANTIREMLGMIETESIIKLFDSIVNKIPGDAIKIFNHLYIAGLEPSMILQNILEILYGIAIKITTKQSVDSIIDEKYINSYSEKLSFSKVHELWQSIFKGIQEIKVSLDIRMATEMIILRSCYLVSLPSISSILSKIDKKDELADINMNSILKMLKEENEILLYKYLFNYCDSIFTEENYVKLKSYIDVPNDYVIKLQSFIQKKYNIQHKIIVQKIAKNKNTECKLQNDTVKEVLDLFDKSKLVNTN